MQTSFVVLSSAIAAVSSATPLAAQVTQRVSVSWNGQQSNGPSLGPGGISASGLLVAFESNATNLVIGDTNDSRDVFVHDRSSGVTELVSLSTIGVPASHASYAPQISADGARVAFISVASNLVTGDTNNTADVFLRDRMAGTTTRVSVSSAGLQAIGDSTFVAISTDGQCVAFTSVASNLTPFDTNSAQDVFVHDVQAASTTRVSVATGGVQANGGSQLPALSSDGRYAVFASLATNLVASDTNGVSDVFVHDRLTLSTVRVSVDSNGVPGNAGSAVGVERPAISHDGRVVAFSSLATNLVAGDTNGHVDVFVHDLSSGATTRVSVDSAGVQSNGLSLFPSASADGRFVAFSSHASNLVASDDNSAWDVFLHDRATGATRLASIATSGTQAAGNSGLSLPPSISGDGHSIAFASGASNLVSGDTNGSGDVFVRDVYGAPFVYCTSGTTSNGCLAAIAASATPDVAQLNSCVISISSVDGQRSGIVFYGLTALIQPWCSSGGTSFLCVKPPTQRSAPQNSGGSLGQCNGVLSLDWNAFQSATPGALGPPWTVGSSAFVQGWFRDPLNCKWTSLSNALQLTYQP